jgi:hypothetical protein
VANESAVVRDAAISCGDAIKKPPGIYGDNHDGAMLF